MTRNSLEQYAWDALTKAGIDFSYEGINVTLLPAFECPAWEDEKQVLRVRPITYTPDFVGSNWVIETKGFFRPESRLRWKMFKNIIKDSNINIFMPKNKKQVDECIATIKKINDDCKRADWRILQIATDIKLTARFS